MLLSVERVHRCSAALTDKEPKGTARFVRIDSVVRVLQHDSFFQRLQSLHGPIEPGNSLELVIKLPNALESICCLHGLSLV